MENGTSTNNQIKTGDKFIARDYLIVRHIDFSVESWTVTLFIGL